MNAKPSAATLELVDAAYKQFSGNLQRYLLRRLWRREDLDDAVQEVYVRLLHNDKLEKVENPLAFLCHIASCVAYDRNRKEGLLADRFVPIEDLPTPLEEESSRLSEEDSSERLNLQLQLKRALAQLPPMHAAILLCIKRDGLSYAETAKRVRLPKTQVVRYFIEAKARMKMLTWDR